MKFGHTLLTHQVPEWQQHYIDYKGLKKIIKAIYLRQQEVAESDPDVDVHTDSQVKIDLARFFFHLDVNLEKVNDFYTSKYLDYKRRLNKIANVLDQNADDIPDAEEYDDLLDILLELRNCFRNLKWFAELNRRGFVKILKKLDKKAGTFKQEEYLKLKVYTSSFCNESETIESLTLINKHLNKLLNSSNNVQSENLSSSSTSTISNLEINNTMKKNVSLSETNPTKDCSQSPINFGVPHTKVSSLDVYSVAIKNDDAEKLETLLNKNFMSLNLAPLRVLLSLLNKATLECSYKCIDSLLQIIPVLSNNSDVSGRNFLHHHVIALGKKTLDVDHAKNKILYNAGELKRADYNESLLKTSGPDGINSNNSFEGLLYMFENLPPHLKFAILENDNYKRSPLHYAAQYGLKEVTHIIIRFLKEWNMFNDSVSLDDVKVWGDAESLTPIHLAILGKHPKTANVLFEAMDKNISLTCPYLIHVATRMNNPELLKLIIKCKGIDINYFENSESKETSLYVACKLNLKESVKTLLENGADTEIGEATFGWTPIFVAAANGYEEIVDLLIASSAKYYIYDESGWNPREHAALRGHINIIDKLTPENYDPYESLDITKSLSPRLAPQVARNSSTSSIHKLSDSRSKTTPEPSNEAIDLNVLKAINNSSTQLSINETKKDKTVVGNRYLKKGESLILISIGTTDLRDETPAIELNKIPSTEIHSTELDSALSLVVTSPNVDPENKYSLSLPLDDNHGSSTDPITFKCIDEDPFNATLYFDLIPTFDYEVNKVSSTNKKLGRGVAILKNLYTGVGSNKRSLFNCVRIPILSVNTMEVIGVIKFEVLIVKSFEETDSIPLDADIYWKSLRHPRLIGHRGNGMNSRNKKSLQLGENTVESFIAAASLGAQYVEFDVQLTKDDIPVIYHDFIIAESGIDIPMQSLTLEQFMHLNLGKDKHNNVKENAKIVKDDLYIRARSKSNNKLEEFDEDTNNQLNNERMKLTKTWKAKEFKANTRGSTIASSFTTLEELFDKVPKEAGFNIELKYPMLDESEADDIGQIAPEMNHFCDVILQLVYKKYNNRNVIFSSFHPDICLIMTLKQPSFPVLFLTESGVNFMADVRASSLQNAIRFAKNWKLFGIVSDSVPLIKCPRLASVVKASGLACFTYGSENNNPENARLQIDAGVDAVIVDSVIAVRNELSRYDDELSKLN